MGKIKFCRKCNENHEEMFNGYFNWLKDDCYECPIKTCGNKLIDLNIDTDDFDIIHKISHENSFLDAMIDLKEKDPIEYQLKLSQFKTQVQQQENIQKQKNDQSKVHCPYCNSIKVKKISGTERVTSVAILGIFSKKINKSFKCESCGGTF